MPAAICGMIAAVLSIMTNFSPLTMIPRVIVTQNPSYINMPIVGATVVNCALWTIYSLIKSDIPFFSCQVMGLISGLL